MKWQQCSFMKAIIMIFIENFNVVPDTEMHSINLTKIFKWKDLFNP
jgi:hypothetical protein